MKKYKVESLIFYSKVTLDKNHLLDSSTEAIQEKLDEYVAAGWSLASTEITNFGSAVYIYLFFEKDDMLDVRGLE
jgi:hypothetical protein